MRLPLQIYGGLADIAPLPTPHHHGRSDKTVHLALGTSDNSQILRVRQDEPGNQITRGRTPETAEQLKHTLVPSKHFIF